MNSIFKTTTLTTILYLFIITILSAESTEQQPATHDDDLTKIVEKAKAKTDKIEYTNGKLTLYASPPTAIIVENAIYISMAAFIGTFGAYLLIRDDRIDPVAIKMLGVITVGAAGGIGIWSGANLGNLIKLSRNRIPYLIFDNNGISIFNEKHIDWKDVADLEILKTIPNNRRELILLDRFGKALIKISDVYAPLPISFKKLVKITELYFNRYNRSAEAYINKYADSLTQAHLHLTSD
jgi:hypothetical protein